MATHTVTVTKHENGMLLERSDGEKFLLEHLNEDGSASLVHITPGAMPWAVHLDRNIGMKLDKAKDIVAKWPNNSI